jgi:Bacterial Ig domain
LVAYLVVDGVTGQVAAFGSATFYWDTQDATDGVHQIAVTATDSTGTTVTSSSLELVVDNTPPQANLISPTEGQHLTGATTLTVEATDASGIKSVQFWVDGNPYGPLLTSPDPGHADQFSLGADPSTFGPPPGGLHHIQAHVTDNAGNSSVSQSVNVYPN